MKIHTSFFNQRLLQYLPNSLQRKQGSRWIRFRLNTTPCAHPHPSGCSSSEACVRGLPESGARRAGRKTGQRGWVRLVWGQVGQAVDDFLGAASSVESAGVAHDP